jgi:hypothetical protein
METPTTRRRRSSATELTDLAVLKKKKISLAAETKADVDEPRLGVSGVVMDSSELRLPIRAASAILHMHRIPLHTYVPCLANDKWSFQIAVYGRTTSWHACSSGTCFDIVAAADGRDRPAGGEEDIIYICICHRIYHI